MTIAFVGGEITSFIPSETVSREFAGQYFAPYARCSLHAIGGAGAPYFLSPVFTPVVSAWMHVDLATDGGTGVNQWVDRVVMIDSGGVDRVKFQSNEVAGGYRLVYSTGSGFTQAGAVYVVDANNVQTFDIQAKCNSGAGRIRLFNSGTGVIDSGSIDTTAIPDIARVRVQGSPNFYPQASTGVKISQMIVANRSTIGWKLATYVPSGAGSDSAWAGAYGDIDEIIYDDGDFISTAAANAVSTFALTGTDLGTSHVLAVAVTARARHSELGPQNMQLALRSGGANFFSATKTLDVGFLPEIEIWETDPATGLAWVTGAIASIQAGAKSIA